MLMIVAGSVKRGGTGCSHAVLLLSPPVLDDMLSYLQPSACITMQHCLVSCPQSPGQSKRDSPPPILTVKSAILLSLPRCHLCPADTLLYYFCLTMQAPHQVCSPPLTSHAQTSTTGSSPPQARVPALGVARESSPSPPGGRDDPVRAVCSSPYGLAA